MQSVAIVGVGLIGGSFGLALRKAGFTGPITGVSSKLAIAEGIAAKAIDRGATLPEAAANADLIYLAQPVSKIIQTLAELDQYLKPGTLVTDAGSTKVQIATQGWKHIKNGIFLPGHPMAGKEKRGALAADADLFRGKTYFLCPEPPDQMFQPAIESLEKWLHKIGARTALVSAAAHDRLVAFTSHLPQLVSTGLASMLAGSLEPDLALMAAGTGLTDMTRLALSSHELWADIISTNSAAIDQALGQYISHLEEMRKRLAAGSLEAEFFTASNLATVIRKR
jgi:prephenate dehydrogenase